MIAFRSVTNEKISAEKSHTGVSYVFFDPSFLTLAVVFVLDFYFWCFRIVFKNLMNRRPIKRTFNKLSMGILQHGKFGLLSSWKASRERVVLFDIT